MVSSYAGFLHGEEYPCSTYDGRTISVQCRFLLSLEELMLLQNHRTVRAILARWLLKGAIRAPSTLFGCFCVVRNMPASLLPSLGCCARYRFGCQAS